MAHDYRLNIRNAQQAQTYQFNGHPYEYYDAPDVPRTFYADRPTVKKPVHQLDTPYGTMFAEVHPYAAIYFKFEDKIKINNVRYRLTGRFELIREREEWMLIVHLERGNVPATDNARKKVHAALYPVLEAWISKNYECLSDDVHTHWLQKSQIAAHRLDSFMEEIQRGQALIRDIQAKLANGEPLTELGEKLDGWL